MAKGCHGRCHESGEENVKGVSFLPVHVKDVDMQELMNLGDQLKAKLGDGVILLASENGGKVSLLAMATDGAMKKGTCRQSDQKQWLKLVGGGGGGRRIWLRQAVRILQVSIRHLRGWCRRTGKAASLIAYERN